MLCVFNLTTQSKIYISARNGQVWKTIVALKPIFGKILLDKDWPFFCPHINAITSTLRIYILVICETTSVRSSEDFKISARVRQSSVTSNTLWASVNFLGQITVQRYVVFVSTVELRTLYIQELPYMNTFLWMHLEKIGPMHAHFQYNARKLMSLKSVFLWGILREN